MPTDPRYLPPLEMPPPAAPVPVDVLVDAPLAPPVPAPDYELVATMGRQLSEPVAQMQSIVQALLDTGKISRRKVQMLLGELAAIRRLSMQGQQLQRLVQSPLRQSHERVRLDQLLLQPATLTEAALQQLFGLENTALKPLADSLLPEPLLVIWQKEQLRAAWQQQDDAARSAWS